MSGARAPFDDVALAAPVSFGYARSSRRQVHWFLGRVLAELIGAAGLAKSEIDGLAVASYGLYPDNAAALSQYFGLEPRWLVDFPYGGASGVIAACRAARAVQAGDAEVVACLAADVMSGGAFASLVANFSSFARDHVYPYGGVGPNGVFALITENYMRRFGASRDDFGRICVAQRRNARANPQALLRNSLTMQAYLAARAVAPPLGLYDCVMPCCGAEGFLVMGADRAQASGLAFARIAGAIERHNAHADDPVHVAGGWTRDREALYQAAGAEPGDMAFLQAYDDYPVMVMIQLEDLGFCDKGKAPDLVRGTDLTTAGGGLPLNTGGGQLSVGQAGAAGGFLGVVEGLRQITGQALGEQVPAGRFGLVSGYGTVIYDRGLCTAAAILVPG